MEENKSKGSSINGGMIRKGPWKPEEDQVLINHVKKYGPRDWSSIRSKGLLQRTGKSCRLRWVNKLRPNLKNGCKFSAEEERIVIDLQAQLGNKWATIATHLPGRTDNDVKNFWSSRQKRLARILQHSSQSHTSCLPNKPHNKPSSSSSSTANANATFCAAKRPRSTSLQAPRISSCLMEGETSSKRRTTCYQETTTIPPIPMKMAPLEDPVNPTYPDPVPINTDPLPINIDPHHTTDLNLQELPFPAIPDLQTDLSLPSETQELIDRLDASFLDPFACHYEQALLSDEFRLMPCLGGGGGGGESSSSQVVEIKGGAANDNDPLAQDSFFDDFPSDMFDQIGPLPSPSRW